MCSRDQKMGSSTWNVVVAVVWFLSCSSAYADDGRSVSLSVDASRTSQIPDTLMGVFFEEINHAGTGGLWAELVMNKGFEAGGHHSPSHIIPWKMKGNEKSIYITTEPSSCFENNKMALRMDVLCDGDTCPKGGVGVFNPGFYGMNIENGKQYNVSFYARSTGALELAVSFVGEDGEPLETANVYADAAKVENWTKIELTIEAKGTDRNASLHLATTKSGTIWLDQVSAMPVDTHKGHGFRKDLMQMVLNLKPRFLRFPGGCFVEGGALRNSFRWKETVGPSGNRPGHFNDIWHYWTDDGLGYLEYLQLAEDLGAAPVWVINVGIAHTEEVQTALTGPFVQEMLDSLEFARGHINTTWGSLRAQYGHPEPFDLKHVAVGNENCDQWRHFTEYRGNYLKFYNAIKSNYPDVQIVNNCDATNGQLDVPADLFDFHIYVNPESMFNNAHKFDHHPRFGPKVFVSEYAVTEPGNENDNGTLIGALGEAAFVIGLERNSDVVSMASYAPLFMHRYDPQWKPDAINFDSHQAFGIPSYWMQTFFTESSGAQLLNVTESTFDKFIASAIRYKSNEDNSTYIKIKAVNFDSTKVQLSVSLKGVAAIKGSKKTILTSEFPHDYNSFENPRKVIPQFGELAVNGTEFNVDLRPYSFTSLDFLDLSGEGSKAQKKAPGYSRSRKEGRSP